MTNSIDFRMPSKQMPKETLEALISEWTKRLRSGDYKQGKQYLRLKHVNEDGSDGGDHFCCLGVLMDTMDIPCKLSGGVYHYGINRYAPPKDVNEYLSMRTVEIDALTEMNDKESKSFAEIADYIEANKASIFSILAPADD